MERGEVGGLVLERERGVHKHRRRGRDGVARRVSVPTLHAPVGIVSGETQPCLMHRAASDRRTDGVRSRRAPQGQA